MEIVNDTNDVTTYFVLRDSTAHAPKTNVTITDIDLYYIEQGAAMADKVDATALDAADSAHADNKAYNVGQGLYRIDWPDAAFDGGVGKYVYLIVVCTGVDTTFLEVKLKDPEQTGDSYARLGAPAGASVSADIAAIEAQTDDIGAAGAGLSAIPWNAAWDAEVESEVDDALGGGTGTALTAIPWNAAWDAEVESEVDDALGGGTGTALTAVPWNAAWDAEVESEVNDALVALNLDHLMKTAVADGDDLTTEVADGTVLSNILSATGDTSDYARATDSLEVLGTSTAAILADTGTDGVAIADGAIDDGKFAAAAIDAAAIATGAIDADALAQDAAQEIADEVLNRNLAGGGSGNTRNVRNALRVLRNNVSIAAGTMTVTTEDDATEAWTAEVETAAGNPISAIKPAGP